MQSYVIPRSKSSYLHNSRPASQIEYINVESVNNCNNQCSYRRDICDPFYNLTYNATQLILCNTLVAFDLFQKSTMVSVFAVCGHKSILYSLCVLRAKKSPIQFLRLAAEKEPFIAQKSANLKIYEISDVFIFLNVIRSACIILRTLSLIYGFRNTQGIIIVICLKENMTCQKEVMIYLKEFMAYLKCVTTYLKI